jgi:hypothetical protein
MTRVTPLRLTTLQCSQIGFTLERTFTVVLLLAPGPAFARNTTVDAVSHRTFKNR